MPTTAPKKIMVASSVYGFETVLTQICTTIESSGFAVLNSHYGTIVPDSRLSNLDNCLKAVRECDVFVGIIRPFYGSGIIGDISITHAEFREAVRLNKQRYFFSHGYVSFARQLLKQFMYSAGVPTGITITRTAVMDDIRVINMYDEVVQSSTPVENRTGNWIQEFYNPQDLFRSLNVILEAEK